MAGGSGTRLWPLSRKSFPKQFSNLFGDDTLFQQSAIRLTSSRGLQFHPHVTLTNEDFRFIVGEQFYSAELCPGPIIIEPSPKNTAPAILAATMLELQKNSDAILLVAPTDHVIPNTESFHEAIRLGLEGVRRSQIVTFGIKPARPETGYGYLRYSGEDTKLKSVNEFVEKPKLHDAKKMLASGDYLWNSGIFLFRAIDMFKAFEKFQPRLIECVEKSISGSGFDLGFLRLSKSGWEELESISIDYAIMEKMDNLLVVPYSESWSDLGDWQAVWDNSDKDENWVVKSKNAHAVNCKQTLLRSENENQQIVGLGLKDIVAVAMPDAVLVADLNSSQDVKLIVDQLRQSGVTQAEMFPRDHRPWGWFESLILDDRFQVKRIHVKQGGSLSLQSHLHRSEHWIVVSGTAKVTNGESVTLITEGQSTYIPLGSKHRLENPGKVPLEIIEIQTGTYFGEDDIIRYEDNYSRT